LLYKAVLRTFLGIFNPKLWLLSVLPLLIAGGVWGFIGYCSWDFLSGLISKAIEGWNESIFGFSLPSSVLAWLPVRAVWVVFILLTLSLPLVWATALFLCNWLGTQTVARRLGKTYALSPITYSKLGNSRNAFASVWHSLWVLLVLIVIWLFSLPLCLLFGLGFFVHVGLTSWANARLFSHDILIEFANKQERTAILEAHRIPLWTLGLIASFFGFLPSGLWLGGVFIMPFLPTVIFVSMWLAIMVFLATSTLFSHYLLPALSHYRLEQAAINAAADAQIHGEIIEASVQEVPTLSQLHLDQATQANSSKLKAELEPASQDFHKHTNTQTHVN
jgi:Etoposide-induced protein 2.4 (EI24)